MTAKLGLFLASVLANVTLVDTLWAQSAPLKGAPAAWFRSPPTPPTPPTPPAPPPMHPLNGVIRLGLELGALTAMGLWAFQRAEGAPGYALLSPSQT